MRCSLAACGATELSSSFINLDEKYRVLRKLSCVYNLGIKPTLMGLFSSHEENRFRLAPHPPELVITIKIILIEYSVPSNTASFLNLKFKTLFQPSSPLMLI